MKLAVTLSSLLPNLSTPNMGIGLGEHPAAPWLGQDHAQPHGTQLGLQHPWLSSTPVLSHVAAVMVRGGCWWELSNAPSCMRSGTAHALLAASHVPS